MGNSFPNPVYVDDILLVSSDVNLLIPFFDTCQDGQSGLISRRKVIVYVDSR
jgi:hypothetical protein